MRPIDLAFLARERQAETLAWWNTARAERFAAGFQRSLNQQAQMVRRQAPPVASLCRHILERAHTYAVTADVQKYLLHAASQMELQPYLEGDLPEPAGFVFLEDEIIMTDIRGRHIYVGAISWCLVTNQDQISGIAVATYSTERDPEQREFMRQFAERGLTHPSLALFDLQTFGFGVKLQVNPYAGQDAIDPAVAKVAEQSQRLLMTYLATFFAFVKQKLLTATPVRPYRGLERRTRKWVHIPHILLIELRRHEFKEFPGDSEAMHREWSHRWIVSGHWRQQWYPSLGHHRQIWISPFVKGPEDLPLIIKEKLYVVER